MVSRTAGLCEAQGASSPAPKGVDNGKAVARSVCAHTHAHTHTCNTSFAILCVRMPTTLTSSRVTVPATLGCCYRCRGICPGQGAGPRPLSNDTVSAICAQRAALDACAKQRPRPVAAWAAGGAAACGCWWRRGPVGGSPGSGGADAAGMDGGGRGWYVCVRGGPFSRVHVDGGCSRLLLLATAAVVHVGWVPWQQVHQAGL